MVMMGMIVMMLNDSVVDGKDCCSFLFLATLCEGKNAPANKVQTLPVSTCRKRIITQRKETDFDCK